MKRSEILSAEKKTGGMYAVIPSVVLLDDTLSISAKMLYGIIVWTCSQHAYTWASNSTLGSYLGLSKKRTSELVTQLEQQGHIETDVIRDPETKQIEKRLIYPIVKSSRGILKNRDTPIPKKTDTSPEKPGYPIPKNQEEKIQNRKDIYNPLPPKEGKADKYLLSDDVRAILNHYVGTDRQLAQALKDMVDNRADLKAVNSARAIKAMLRELDKHSFGSRANKLALLNKAVASGWKTVYSMRADELPDPPPQRVEIHDTPNGGRDAPHAPRVPVYVRTETDPLTGEERDIYE